MIDIDKFIKKEDIVPILNNSFLLDGKRYHINNIVENGWYQVQTHNNSTFILENIIPESINFKTKTIKGYTYNNQIVFQNFDAAKRKVGKEVMAYLNFNTLDNFNAVEAIQWEDGNLYYYKSNYMDSFIYEIKQAIEENTDINTIKGVTPELRTLCLFHSLEQEKLKELQKQKEIEELKKTLEGRLLLSFQRVGAELIQYSISGNRLIVDWRIGKQQFNSVLNRNTFRVLEAGYCMSGDDKKHNLHSLVVLAKEYDKDNLIYKTRE